jgi:hypothetical protein
VTQPLLPVLPPPPINPNANAPTEPEEKVKAAEQARHDRAIVPPASSQTPAATPPPAHSSEIQAPAGQQQTPAPSGPAPQPSADTPALPANPPSPEPNHP